MSFNRIAVVLAVLAVSAGAAASAYRPAKGHQATGYADERLADNRFRVTFTGSSATRREK